MKNKVGRISAILISIITIFLLILWFTGIIGLWSNGIAYIANNTKEFTDVNGHVIGGHYSISINLENLQSNRGKELYNDGSSRIFVDKVDNVGNYEDGYRINFRSCGQYSLNYATLVSGIHHETLGEHSFTYNMSAKMTAKYYDKIYNCGLIGMSGLNYKNGDEFSFYIFPSEAYKKGQITSHETGVVRFTVTKLYKNIWSKK